MSNSAGPPSSDGYDGKDPEVARGAKDTSLSSGKTSLRNGESDSGVWASGGNLDSYRPIPEYEGIHRFDPLYEWTEKEELGLVRRVCVPSWNPAMLPACATWRLIRSL